VCEKAGKIYYFMKKYFHLFISFLNRPPACLLSLCIIFMMSEIIPAQDSHYWTDQYGTQAQLIGGLVVGSTSDLSSTYYNPGAISLSSDQSLVISTSAFEVIGIDLSSKSGRELDLNSVQTRPAPGIFAFRFWYDSLQNDHLSLSVLTRRDADHDFHTLDFTDNLSPISQKFAWERLAFNRLTETWLGLSYSHRLSAGQGIGITQYLAVRSQRVRVQGIHQSIDESGEGSSEISVVDWRSTHLRLLWKAGYIYKTEGYSWGITLTTPGLNIYGNGSGYYNASIIGSGSNPQLLSLFGEDLDVSYQSPLSIAVGGAWQAGNSTVYLSGEYFTRVAPFNLMVLGGPAGAASTTAPVKLSHELEPVFNFGIGIAHKFTDLFSLYGSVITNHSGVIPGTPSDLNYTVYDIYHFSLGSSFSFFGMMLTLGIAYGTGPETDLPEGSDASQNQQLPYDQYEESYRISYRSVKLLLGFSTVIQ